MDPNSIYDTNQESLQRTATLPRPLQTLLHNLFRSQINSAKQKKCEAKSVKDKAKLQCQERVQAATEQNHQKETLNINQNIKKKRLKNTRNNNLLMINNKLIIYKNETKGFWNYL